MAEYFTYKRDVPLLPGQTVAFRTGRGYYAAGAPQPLSEHGQRGGDAKPLASQPKPAVAPPPRIEAPAARPALTSDAPKPQPAGILARARRPSEHPTSGAATVPASEVSRRPAARSITPTASSPTPTAKSATAAVTRYFTSKSEVVLRPGAAVAFAPGKGYYARQQVDQGSHAASSGGYGSGARKGTHVDGLSQILPNIEVALSRTKTVKIESPQVTITSHLSAEVLVAEHSHSKVSIRVDPARREGSIKVKGGDLAVTIDSVLSRSELRNRDMISQLARHAIITGDSTHALDLGRVPVAIGGRKLLVPATATLSISVTPPATVKAEVAIELSVWDARGNLTTVELTLAIDADVAFHPHPKFRLRDPFPAMAHQVEHVVEAGLQELSKILQHAPKLPGGGPVPIPAPAGG